MERKRNPSFDILKGIAIILMVIGHFPSLPTPIWRIIYSFHMPLFFIVSGVFFKHQSIHNQFYNDTKRLLLPLILVLLFLCILDSSFLNTSLQYSFSRLFFLSPFSLDIKNVNLHFKGIGSLWFIVALFWCRTIYNSLYRKRILLMILTPIITYIGSKAVPFTPFSLFQGFSAIPFYMLGSIWGGGKE